MDKVCILATGGSLNKFKGADCPIWAVGSSYPKLKADLYFWMHSFDKLPKDVEAIYQNNFPLSEIIEMFGSSFFTNTVSYMIAYAIYLDVKTIEVYGVDLDAESEYEHQKPSVCYWLAYARGKGVKVNVHSSIDKTDFIYGYEPTKKLLEAMNERLEMSNQHLAVADNDKEKNQWLGQINDLKYWKRRLRQ